MTRVAVTGGAGFIGRKLVDGLVAQGHGVRVLDNMDAQAHPDGGLGSLTSEAELVMGDVRDSEAVDRMLEDVEVVFHLAAMVGNGQSMYEIRRYIDVNAGGTAVLLERVLARRDQVRRLIVASSMVVYGEGAYRCPACGVVAPSLRDADALSARRWEVTCPRCGGPVEGVPTPEDHPLKPASPYAISKRDAEELILTAGHAHGLETVALRYLNVYGPGQALSNPYTGVAAIFCTRLLHNQPPLIFEDGQQRRDLVHVSDVVRATLLAMDAPKAAGLPINIGTGTSITVAALARELASALGRAVEPVVSGEFRAGDIRHCWADVTRAREILGFEAAVDRQAAIQALAAWVSEERPEDRTGPALQELRARGLVR